MKKITENPFLKLHSKNRKTLAFTIRKEHIHKISKHLIFYSTFIEKLHKEMKILKPYLCTNNK